VAVRPAAFWLADVPTGFFKERSPIVPEEILMKLRELAGALGCEVAGNAELEIAGVAPMEHAGPNELTFLANPKYAHKVKDTKAGAILISEPVRDLPITSVVSSNPYLDFARALEMFYRPPRPAPGIHPLASIAPSARIGEGASIGAFAVVGENVSIGRNAVLHPRHAWQRRRRRWRRFRFRAPTRRNALQDRAIGHHGDRGRRGNSVAIEH
jgi:hypothetical protein